VESRNDLIDSLSEEELREVYQELARMWDRHWDRQPVEWRTQHTATNMLHQITSRIDGVRGAVDLLLRGMPDVDLAAVVQRVRLKKRPKTET
jgi:nitrogen-specific signal transduction histidine kinase